MRKIIYFMGIILIIAGCSAVHTITGWLPGNIFGNHDEGLSNKEMKKFISSIRSQPNDPMASYRLAKYYIGQKQYDKAVEEFRRAISLKPDFLEAHNGLGVTYDLKGMYQKAALEYTKALEINSERVSVINNLGYSYFLQGKYQEAVANFKKALSLDEGNKKALNNLDLVSRKLGISPKTLEKKPKILYPAGQMLSRIDGHTPPKKLFSDKLSLAPNLFRVKDESWVFKELSTKDEIEPKKSAFIIVEESPGISRLEPLISKEKKDQPLQAFISEPRHSEDFRVEVSNGNGGSKMAYWVGEYLKDKGYRVVRLTNADHFIYGKTMILYQGGYAQQATALDIEIPEEQELLKTSANREDIHVRVLLGRDLLPLANIFLEKTDSFKKEETDQPLQASISEPRHSEDFRVEISNGNGRNKMAYWVGEYLKDKGYRVVRLTNADHFVHGKTVILYQGGYAQQATAVDDKIPGEQELLKTSANREDIQVRVLLGRDLLPLVNTFQENTDPLKVAQIEP